jgi:hypothetical protein
MMKSTASPPTTATTMSSSTSNHKIKCQVLGYELEESDPKKITAFQFKQPIEMSVFLSSLNIPHPIVLDQFVLDPERQEYTTIANDDTKSAVRTILNFPMLQYGLVALNTSSLTASSSQLFTSSFWSGTYPNYCNITVHDIISKCPLLNANPTSGTNSNIVIDEKKKLIVQEMLNESNEDDKRHKHWTIKSLIDYEFTEWTNELFQDYFSESNAYRNFAREPTLAKISNFRRYGPGAKFLFECVFKHPKVIARFKTNTTSSSSSSRLESTTSSNQMSVWISYNQLMSNPRYQTILKTKYHWSMNEEKDKYDSGCDSEQDQEFEKHLDCLGSTDDDGDSDEEDDDEERIRRRKRKLDRETARLAAITQKKLNDSRLRTKIYAMDSRKTRTVKS